MRGLSTPPAAPAPLALLALAVGCTGSPAPGARAGDTGDGTRDLVLAMSPLPALPADPTNAVADDPTAAWFGRYLFSDPRLSGSGEFACSTCHDPLQGWGDGKRLSEAAGTAGRHAPGLWNAGHQRWLFWDGRCDTLWCQAAQPIEAEVEMGGSRVQVARAIADNEDLRQGYEAVFGPVPDLSDEARFPARARPVPADPGHPDAVAWAAMDPADQDRVTGVFVDVTKAIAAFERTLESGEAPIDRYVAALAADDRAGMDAALSPQAQEGLALFVGEGQCHLCHAGPLFTNLEFASVGLGPRDWLDVEDRGRYDGISALQADPLNAAGRWSDAPAGAAADRDARLVQGVEQVGLFKVPSLRGVAASAPYMHGGHFDDLTAVVQHYNRLDEELAVGHLDDFMVPRGWDDDQVASLVAFLEALGAGPADPTVLEAPDTPLPP